MQHQDSRRLQAARPELRETPQARQCRCAVGPSCRSSSFTADRSRPRHGSPVWKCGLHLVVSWSHQVA